jgi:hypothetical protein
MSDRKIMSPHEAQIDQMTQIIACLLGRLQGEAVINRHELESYFDTKVLTEVISGDYVRLYLKDEDQSFEIEIVDLPDDRR